jgi:predicted amidohydrolase
LFGASEDRTVSIACSDRTLGVATVAMTPDADPRTNLERIERFVGTIVATHPSVRLILFGETILGWFYKKGETEAYHRRIAETIPGDATRFVARLARQHEVYVSFGLTETRDGKLFNAQVLIDPNGEILAAHRKFWIRNRVFAPGERRLTTADIDGFKAALLICADARSLWLRRAIRRARVDVVLASLADYGTSLVMNEMIGTFYDAWTLVANRYGEEPPLTWHGLISISDRLGRLRAHGIGEERFLYFRIPLDRAGAIRSSLRRLAAGGRLLLLATRMGSGLIAQRLRRKPREEGPSE